MISGLSMEDVWQLAFIRPSARVLSTLVWLWGFNAGYLTFWKCRLVLYKLRLIILTCGFVLRIKWDEYWSKGESGRVYNVSYLRLVPNYPNLFHSCLKVYFVRGHQLFSCVFFRIFFRQQQFNNRKERHRMIALGSSKWNLLMVEQYKQQGT